MQLKFWKIKPAEHPVETQLPFVERAYPVAQNWHVKSELKFWQLLA